MLLIEVILPLFLVVALGWLAGKTGYLPAELSQPLVRYLFLIAAPAVIFYSISQYHSAALFIWRYWFAYILDLILMTALAWAIFRYLFRRDNFVSMMAGLSAGVPNTLMIGYPILAAVVGPKAIIPVAITVIIFGLIFLPVISLVLELHKHQKDKSDIVKKIFSSIIKSPIIISSFLGLIFSVFSIPVPTFLLTSIRYFGDSFIALALFSIGLEMSAFKFKANLRETLMISLINLLFAPIFAIFLSFALHLSPFYAVSLVVLCSMPTAKIIFIYAKEYHLFVNEVAAIVSFTTVFSLITIPVSVYVCNYLWSQFFANIS